jgi:ATP-binding cassette subfamily B protein/ATP-binding cassette subfamily C protein
VLLPYLRDQRPALLLAAVLSLLGAGTSLLQPLLVRRTLDAVGARAALLVPVALLVGVLLADAVLRGIRVWLLARAGEGVVLATRRGLAGKLLRLPIAEYDRRRLGDLISRVGADTTLLRSVVTSGLADAASSVVLLVGAAVAMALLDPLLLTVAVLVIGAGLTVIALTSRRVRRLSLLAQHRVGQMTASVERALGAVRTVRASRAEQREADQIGTSALAAYDAGIRTARLQAVIGPAGAVAMQGAALAVLAVGGARVASGALGIGSLIAFMLYLFLLVGPIAGLVQTYLVVQTALGALARILEIDRLPAEDDGDARLAPPPVPGAPLLRLDRVSFGYPEPVAPPEPELPGRRTPAAAGAAPEAAPDPSADSAGRDRPVLREVSFEIPRGTRTALVGPSGAGKSTVLALVERFYEVTGGAILMDGVDLRALPRDALRARIGYVEQDAPAVAGTVRDNLLLGAPGRSDGQLLAVLDSVNLGELVRGHPAGLDTQVGDGGVLLSGGERQRLAIARVLLAAPPLLLLDEPTSNLDARNEQALRVAVDAVARDRTLLIVAHRLSTVADADQIVVLDGGRVLATGRHAELIETSPLYREFATHQLLVT